MEGYNKKIHHLIYTRWVDYSSGETDSGSLNKLSTSYNSGLETK